MWNDQGERVFVGDRGGEITAPSPPSVCLPVRRPERSGKRVRCLWVVSVCVLWVCTHGSISSPCPHTHIHTEGDIHTLKKSYCQRKRCMHMYVLCTDLLACTCQKRSFGCAHFHSACVSGMCVTVWGRERGERERERQTHTHTHSFFHFL